MRTADTAIAEPVVATWAPGRVNLIGEHTDYGGGLVLPAAIQLGIALDVLSVADEISLSSERFGPATPFPADGGGAASEGWARYAQAVAAELALLGRPPVGLVGTVASDLPPRAGLSSSAALEVAVALALCAIADFELEPLEVALACQRAEVRAVGVPCGILDQAGCVLGRAGAAVLLNCETLEHRLVPVPARASLLVVDCGVQRRLEATPYALRRHQLERALELDRVSSPLDAVSRRRLRHFRTENERVGRFAAALEADNLEEAGRLLTASHASLRDDYEVSIPELDLLVELAESAGAYGARLLGAGFGGSILALADADGAGGVAEVVADEYRARAGREAGAVVARPSGGARVR
jgi:galactokinase